MNDEIFETVLSTLSPAGVLHLAPMGVRYQGDSVLLMPFRPSSTLDNILATRQAVLNLVLDPRIFAGCVTGRRDWPTVSAQHVKGHRLQAALAHVELELSTLSDDAERPRLLMARVHAESHRPFIGCNRAQAAVIEGAVLVSRLRLLPTARIEAEMAQLQIAIDKTAGPQAREAWAWLQQAVAEHRTRGVGR